MYIQVQGNKPGGVPRLRDLYKTQMPGAWFIVVLFIVGVMTMLGGAILESVVPSSREVSGVMLYPGLVAVVVAVMVCFLRENFVKSWVIYQLDLDSPVVAFRGGCIQHQYGVGPIIVRDVLDTTGTNGVVVRGPIFALEITPRGFDSIRMYVNGEEPQCPYRIQLHRNGLLSLRMVMRSGNGEVVLRVPIEAVGVLFKQVFVMGHDPLSSLIWNGVFGTLVDISAMRALIATGSGSRTLQVIDARLEGILSLLGSFMENDPRKDQLAFSRLVGERIGTLNRELEALRGLDRARRGEVVKRVRRGKAT